MRILIIVIIGLLINISVLVFLKLILGLHINPLAAFFSGMPCGAMGFVIGDRLADRLKCKCL